MFSWLRYWLRRSPHVHIHQRPVQDLRSCIAVIDRFLDNQARYPLEWDDFVSWAHKNQQIESIRLAIAKTEPLCLSEDPAKRREGRAIIVVERNKAATRIGVPSRADEAHSSGNAI